MESEYAIEKLRFDKNYYQEFLIVGDIGGTKTLLAIYGVKKTGEYEKIIARRYKSKHINFFFNLINNLLENAYNTYGIEVSKGSFGVAGPVINHNYSNLTNLIWNIDAKEILNNTALQKVLILNDFEAVSYGVSFIEHYNLGKVHQIIRSGELINAQKNKNIAVMGVGTGLGQGMLFYDNKTRQYKAVPSEGGHTDFPVYDFFDYKLMRFLDKKKGLKHIDYEEIVSGRGIVSLYEFLREYLDEKSEAVEFIDGLPDENKPFQITNHFYNSETCQKTIEKFIEYYARKARDVALTYLSYSGLYLTGGVTLKLKEFIEKGTFAETFEDSPRQKTLLKKIPVFIILDEDIALKGAVDAMLNHYENLKDE